MDIPKDLQFLHLTKEEFERAYHQYKENPFWIETVRTTRKKQKNGSYEETRPLHYFDPSSLLSYHRAKQVDVCMLVAPIPDQQHTTYRIYAILELNNSTSMQGGKALTYISTRRGFLGEGLGSRLLDEFAHFYTKKYPNAPLRISYSTDQDMFFEPTYDRVFMQHGIRWHQQRNRTYSGMTQEQAEFDPDMRNIQDLLVLGILEKNTQKIVQALNEGAIPQQYNAALRNPLVIAMEKYPEALKILHPGKFTLLECAQLLPNALEIQSSGAFHIMAKALGIKRNTLYIAYAYLHQPGSAEKPPLHWKKTTDWSAQYKDIKDRIQNVYLEEHPEYKNDQHVFIPRNVCQDIAFFQRVIDALQEDNIVKENSACATNLSMID